MTFFLIIFLWGMCFCPLLSSPSSLQVWIEKRKMLNLFVKKEVIQNQRKKRGKERERSGIYKHKKI